VRLIAGVLLLVGSLLRGDYCILQPVSRLFLDWVSLFYGDLLISRYESDYLLLLTVNFDGLGS
jgi:hypothetical protein